MNLLIILVSIVLGIQVALFFVIRNKRKKEKENSVIEKYNIKSAGDAFKLLNDPSIPEADRIEIERLYNGEEGS
ncbi:MAG TPA: hypothetical protein PKL31_13915 [Fulvivirga sp.]|nr:hypothetical protein [Fulvivirga sp.]